MSVQATASVKRIRVLLADDNQSLRAAIARLLASVPGIELCGEAENGSEAVEKSLSLRPDVVLMDIGLPELNGLEATRKLRKLAPSVEVLMFTEHESPHAMQAAMDAGARGFLVKTHASVLVDAIRRVAEHKLYSSLLREVSTANV